LCFVFRVVLVQYLASGSISISLTLTATLSYMSYILSHYLRCAISYLSLFAAVERIWHI